MPIPKPLPRKFMTILEEATGDLRVAGSRTQAVAAHFEGDKRIPAEVKIQLREIEATVYRAAFSLSQVQVAETCDGCSLAPALTSAQAHLFVMSNILTDQADLAHRMAEGNVPRVELPEVMRG